MIFVVPDALSLSKSLSRWELAEYVCAGLVTVACFGEFVADFTAWFTGGIKNRKEALAKGSTLVLIFALALELVCLVKTNTLSEMLIGSLGEKAAAADAKAESATQKSLLAENRADAAGTEAQSAIENSSLAESRAGTANSAAGEALRNVDAVATEAKKLNEQLLVTRTQLEAVERKRSELEQSLANLAICNAPRVIPSWSTSVGTPMGVTRTSIDPLKPFAGRQVIMEFVPDAETIRAARSIAAALNAAGWKIVSNSPTDAILDGVVVQPFLAPLPEKGPIESTQLKVQWDADQAVDALVDFLHSYNWQATRGPDVRQKGNASPGTQMVPLGTLRISVGLYPPVIYIPPPAMKDMADAYAQEMDKIQKQLDEGEVKQEEEYMKHMTEEEAKAFKVRIEEHKKGLRSARERSSRVWPCQPLNSLFR